MSEIIPKWLNNSFLEKSLKDYFKDESVFLKSFDVISSTNDRSTNYWCDTVKLMIDFTNSQNELKSKNVTLKIENHNPHMEDGLAKFSPFKRELSFYRDIVPKIEGLLISKNDNETRICRKLICSLNERPSPKFLMFDDDFANRPMKVNRSVGLDVNHLKLVVAKLAKFHAMTAVLYEQNEELFDQHQQPNITENFRLFHSLFLGSFNSVVNGFTFEDEKLYGKLQNFQNFMIQRVSDAFTLQNGEFGVLCHGDLWMNNLLFQYTDDEKLLDVQLDEFGLTFFGSPGIDLTYLLFTSSSSDVRDMEIDILLQHYHEHLQENLINFNYPLLAPTLIQLHNNFLKCGVVGLIYTCLLMPMRSGGMQNEELTTRLEFLFRYFDRKGFFD